VNCFREGTDLIAVGFRAAYTWMRLQEPLDPFMQPDKLMTLLHTAVQLEMPALKALCYEQLCTDRFREETAFQVYLRALKYPQLEELRKLMLQRIGAAFLAVLGGDDFQRMPLEDVITMLQQDSLGVNSEMEVLVAIIRWLNCQSKCIDQATPLLMDCLRLTLLPLPILKRFWRCAMAPPVPDEPFMNAVRGNIHIRERISCAITVVQMHHLHTSRREFLDFCRSKGLLVDMPREWIYDEQCHYHLPRPGGPYSHLICVHVISNYAIQRAQRLMESSKRWPRRVNTYMPPSDDLQTINELPEDKDEEAQVSVEPSAPEMSEGLPQPEEDDCFIARLFRGTLLRLNEVMAAQDRNIERRIDNLIRDGTLRPRFIPNAMSRFVLPTAMTCAAQEDLQEDLFLQTDFYSSNLDAIDAYFFLHVCRMRQLVQPKVVVPIEKSSEESVRPMESYVLETDQMIKVLGF